MLRPRIGRMPDAALTPKAKKLRDELERIRTQHVATESTARRLAGPGATFEAESADAEAAVDAAMRGADLSKLGTPAADRLRADAANAARSADALATAHDRVEWQLVDEFRIALKDPKYSGREQRDAAGKDYRVVLDNFVQARARFLAAQGVVDFVQKAANSPSDRDPASYHPADAELDVDFLMPKNVGIDARYWPKMSFGNVIAALQKEIDRDTT